MYVSDAVEQKMDISCFVKQDPETQRPFLLFKVLAETRNWQGGDGRAMYTS